MNAETTLAILGASGDLAGRLLLPALGELLMEERDRTVHLIGAGSTAMDDGAWRKRVTDAFSSVGAEDALDRVTLGPFLVIDASKAEGIRTIVDAASEGPLVLYFALP
ncbi:MAG TPA: glucose-6-phosphate dehydrogenase, partial [Protaetiibacter sp.]|nr:glucose-6-phosphate dehydrogenase [Protaetiibacter sp.]